MYKYDQYDQAMVDARVAEFRDQVRRRLEGKLSEDQFKPLRLMNGLYLQLHAYMLRVAVPYGTLNSRQMRALADIAEKYDRGYGHFTTRQHIQYNWIKLEDAGDILADLAAVEMHAIQTSGNCIRNISSDHFAGATADELVDPRPYAELLRQWSSFHPEFLALPRKFKIAVIASEADRAAMKLHDIGIRIVKNDAGELGAAFYVGGGMGRTPMIAPCIREFVPLDQLVTYAEACLRVYNRHGRRDNKFKARIKILVHELGADEYTRQVEEEFAHLLDQGYVLDPANGNETYTIYIINLVDESGSGPEPGKWVYVGETSKTPEKRFDEHKNGIRANKDAREHGRDLNYDLMKDIPQVRFRQDSIWLEADTGEKLRDGGYVVEGAH